MFKGEVPCNASELKRGAAVLLTARFCQVGWCDLAVVHCEYRGAELFVLQGKALLVERCSL